VVSAPAVVEFADTLGIEAEVRLVGPAAQRLSLAASSMVMRVHDVSTLGCPADDVVGGAVRAGLTPLLPAATVAAGALDVDLWMDGPVSAVALAGAEEAVRRLTTRVGLHEVSVGAAETVDMGRRSGGRGLLFSRGLDSLATLSVMTGRGEPPSHLVSMDWVDPPFASVDQADILRSTSVSAQQRGLPLIRVSSDARTVLDPIVSWEVSHVAVLVGPVLALSGVLGAIGVSSTSPAGHPHPYVSAVDTDPLWSSGEVAVEHRTDVPGGRVNKAAVVAADPWAMRWLKVCWQRPGDGNCGRCRKCLMTMTALWLVGAGDRLGESFDAPLDAAAVRSTAGSHPLTAPWNFLDVADALGAVGRGEDVGGPIAVGGDGAERSFAAELADAWDTVIDVGRAQVRTGGGMQ
jgi:hypothetical protein